MNKLIISITLSLIVLQIGTAQKVSNINFDEVKALIQDSTSATWYPTLVDRIQKLDTTLTANDYNLLYYGNVFADCYSPYGESKKQEKFLKLYGKTEYDKAIKIGQSVIEENPVNLKILFKMLVCYNQQGDKATAKLYARAYFGLLDAIYRSGDGKSVETAYVVGTVSDEYEMLADMELRITSQSLIGHTDLLKIDMKSQKGKKKDKIKELYFDVSKPFEHLAKAFKNVE